MELSKRCLWHDLLERMRLLSQCSRKRPHLRGSVLFLIVSELLTGVLRKKMRAECLPTRVKKAIFKGLQFSWLEPPAHNRVVPGSNPGGPTSPLKCSLRLRPLGPPAPKRRKKPVGGQQVPCPISPYSLMVEHPVYTRHSLQIREQSWFESSCGDHFLIRKACRSSCGISEGWRCKS